MYLMKAILAILAAAAVVLLVQGCSTEQQTVEEQPESQAEPDAEQPEEVTAQIPALSTLGLRPLELPAERYVSEMARFEVRKAYLEPRGEFINPRRVIELLREGMEEAPYAEEAVAAESGWSGKWPILEEIHDEATALAEAGDFDGAAAKWRGFMNVERALTISVEVDCGRAMLSKSISSLDSLDAPVFLIPITVSDRACYRLCLGLFSTRTEALEWVDKIRLKLPETVPFILEVRRGEW